MDFRIFLTEAESEEKKNVDALLRTIPAKHRRLVHGFKFHFQGGNTLKGDKGHVGVIYQDKITVAAPWRYSREHTVLHEIAHQVWDKLMKTSQKKAWSKLLKATKKEMPKNSALNQNDEEIFCMTYAAAYSKHPHSTYMHDERIEFVKKL